MARGCGFFLALIVGWGQGGEDAASHLSRRDTRALPCAAVSLRGVRPAHPFFACDASDLSLTLPIHSPPQLRHTYRGNAGATREGKMGKTRHPPVFYPTMADMRGTFEAYIESIQEDLEEYGIGRIVPPAGWKPRQDDYTDIDFLVPSPVTQVLFFFKCFFKCLLFFWTDLAACCHRASAHSFADDIPLPLSPSLRSTRRGARGCSGRCWWSRSR